MTLVKKLMIKFKIGDIVWIWKCKNIFGKDYIPNWPKKVFVTKNFKSAVAWTCVISYLSGEENVGKFYEKELGKTNQNKFRVEKVIKRKGDKLSFKWKGYDNSTFGLIKKS